MSTDNRITAVIETVLADWERWAAEAGQQAQQDQDERSYADVMAEHLYPLLADLTRPAPAPMSEKRDWLILSLKHSRGEVLKWYRTASAGYTMSLIWAGRYTEAEARGEQRRCPEHCVAVHIDAVAPFAGMHDAMFNDRATIERLKGLAAEGAVPA